MVSFWPWKGDDSSPASFERALSSLSEKISKKTAHLDSLRQNSRRYKALWTLYTSFAYILYSIISFLVEGWRNWGPVQYTALAGGPMVIYLVRLLIDTFYNYRISKVSRQLEHFHKERETTIDRLKAATKYNSTQQLLEKYGGPSQQSSPKSPGSGKRSSGPAKETPGSSKQSRPKTTKIMPPPTANIPGRSDMNMMPPSTPQQGRPQESRSPPQQPRLDSPPGSPEFAPNAYVAPPQYSSSMDGSGPRWYDRFLDLILGEDETLPQNRYALICKHCRLINGQAPPGTKSLEDIGKWRCAACGGWNGEQTEAKKIMQQMKEQITGAAPGGGDLGSEEKEVAASEVESESEQLAAPDVVDEQGSEVADSQDDEEREGIAKGKNEETPSNEEDVSTRSTRSRTKRSGASSKKKA
ncbi:MAG: hypothetical protein M4579_001859 [Chaenotheca gracillima]|nr:MAG: hypothetical protein M4579_001859 [Chaenotheca gracillima]